MDYKEETRRAYDLHAEVSDQRFEEQFQKNVKPLADFFLENLSGKKIIDLGSGSGNHALYFSQRGYDVLCTDISEGMLELCRRKGLETKLMDLEDLQLPANEYDGAWASASLLHVPREKAPSIIEKIAEILKPGGLFMLAVKEGKEERFETHPKYPNTKRWFVYFSDEEVRGLLEPRFDLIRFLKSDVEGKFFFLNYFCRSKS